jgi:6-pyruvoyltetrahydropterin/6-carboxytetrahydropterin synthase
MNQRMLRKVKVEGGYLNFSAAHFITYSGKCERLHGHNYGVLVEVEGEINRDGLVFDFTVLKKRAKEICQRLDHRFLLPMRNPHLELIALEGAWEIHFGQKRYLFPQSDVVEMPIENSTAELLAEYFCHELFTILVAEYAIDRLYRITVGVEEAATQMAFSSRLFHEE